ncbi:MULTISPECIES: RecB family exonuclease [Pseudonocardia]|uniref:PD-(D/E)XK nuclease superfamily protein n=2 Tax=Pseudonocardia TaxID=1847 RepID=A0A1Y2N228_PSEAH|nr:MULTISPECIES: PD-(D/E)XK nuclease family protein [Pseudonocardia]OSY41502.1 PD-(D/E)XK nuclease superfamily protein [Pseudonocardia autotrophica]TDN71457.1 putative RecB family exonuclease [Pseudonocardia autotrophica]BBG02133.1 exonuclease RecB [Pseudonocardia autotrophica]GEC24147.1 exonuclease RecB [Pseudonocardia saturnea]
MTAPLPDPAPAGDAGTDAGTTSGTARRSPALSPSRAADFRRCPLLYRFRAVDRLPEPPSRAQVRGTLVHAVLEALFSRPPEQRTLGAARELLGPCWDELAAAWPETSTLFDGAQEQAVWLDSAAALLDAYFTLEDPAAVPATAVESRIETELAAPGGPVPLRGILDRLDEAPDGSLRVIDYKTGATPGAGFEGPVLFQLKFYALAVLLARGRMPEELRMLYLADRTVLTYRPDEAELHRFGRLLDALWAAIGRAAPTGDFQPNRGSACRTCDHRERCPAWGGVPPPYPGWPTGGAPPAAEA